MADKKHKLKQNKEQIKHIDDTLDGMYKAIKIFKHRDLETIKEVTVLTNNMTRLSDPLTHIVENLTTKTELSEIENFTSILKSTSDPEHEQKRLSFFVYNNPLHNFQCQGQDSHVPAQQEVNFFVYIRSEQHKLKIQQIA